MRNRNQSLDALRCLAIVLVLGYHAPYYRVLGTGGWIGVDLFFVLSGFLISGLLFEEFKRTGSIDFWRFFWRRGLKIWPPFFLFIYAFIITRAVSGQTIPWRKVLETASFLQSYLSGGMADHTWSLAVEEHFYLMLPLALLLLVFLRRGRANPFTSIPAIFVIVSALCLAMRWQYGHRQALMTHLRIDSLFAGVMLGYLYHFKKAWFKRLQGNHALVIAAACCLPAFFVNELKYQVFGLTALFVGFAFLLAWSIDRRPESKFGALIVGSAAKIGFYSYSIYLWHLMVLDVSTQVHHRLDGLFFWLYVVSAIGAGILAAILIEKPALALRDKKFPVRAMPTTFPARDAAPAAAAAD